MEQWEDRNAQMTADLCDINDARQSIDLIPRRRLAVGSRNAATYISSDYIVRQTIIQFIKVAGTDISLEMTIKTKLRQRRLVIRNIHL